MRPSKILPFLLILITPAIAQAQQILENIPPSIKWHQINSPNFKVLYQQDYLQQAQYTANLLEQLYKPTAQSLNEKPKKISILLQNRSSISNGFVALAPRRSEFFTMPPQDYNFLGTNQWLELLAVHELRHVVQFDKSKTGLTGLASTLLGQQAQAGLANLGVPAWFWEGDAVGIETGLTPSGRGRIPNFNLVFRTHLLEKGGWDYSKQYLRSFQDFVPNHYLTGYYLSTYVRKHHGAEAWSNITEKAFAWPILPNRFSMQMKKQTGKNLDNTYQAMKDELKTLWQEQLDELELTDAQRLTTIPENRFTEYMYPQPHDNGIIALQRGIGDIVTFVNVSADGKINKIYIPGIFNDPGQLSVANHKIVWSEYGFNARWRAVNYSNIKTYDLKTKEHKKLTKRGRFTAPVLSPDGSKIAAVLTTNEQKYYLVIMDATNGNILYRHETPEKNNFISMPRWSNTGDKIVALELLNAGQKRVVTFDAESGAVEELLPASSENIGHPVLYNNYLLYNSPISDIDNIYALDLISGQNYQVTSRPYAAYNPAVSADGKTLYFNDFSAEGMHVAQMPFDPRRWTPIAETKESKINYHQVWVDQEENPEILQEIPDEKYATKRYRRLWHAINPHSWGPILVTTANDIELGIYSQDVLSTTSLAGTFEFNSTERTYNWGAEVSYQGLFPLINLSYDNIERAFVSSSGNERFFSDNVNLQFRLPFNLTNSRYFESLNIIAQSSFTQFNNYSIRLSDDLLLNNFFSNSYEISYNRLLKTSKRDIRPRWGLGAEVSFRHTPFDQYFDLQQYGAQAFALAPGLFKHHSLLIRGGVQYEPSREEFPFSSAIQIPRGYFIYEPANQIYSGSVAYALPLWYPDLHIGKLINFQRFKTNIFYDFGVGINNGLNNYYNSVGMDLTTDFNVLRLLPLLETGLRVTYVPELNDFRYDLIAGYIGF